MKDIFGKALLDYHTGSYTDDIITSTNISGEDKLELPYLFRHYDDMPELEKKALELTIGKTLDVGCGAGNHSLFLKNKGIDVKAIDISSGAIEVTKRRGITDSEVLNILDEKESFDTILLLMNGTGIFETIILMPRYLKHLKSLLNIGGQILIDSSDIKYMYNDKDLKNSFNKVYKYYGELDYFLQYKNEKEIPIKWLYLDFKTLQHSCNSLGLRCEHILNGPHFDYLARIS